MFLFEIIFADVIEMIGIYTFRSIHNRGLSFFLDSVLIYFLGVIVSKYISSQSLKFRFGPYILKLETKYRRTQFNLKTSTNFEKLSRLYNFKVGIQS